MRNWSLTGQRLVPRRAWAMCGGEICRKTHLIRGRSLLYQRSDSARSSGWSQSLTAAGLSNSQSLEWVSLSGAVTLDSQVAFIRGIFLSCGNDSHKIPSNIPRADRRASWKQSPVPLGSNRHPVSRPLSTPPSHTYTLAPLPLAEKNRYPLPSTSILRLDNALA